MACVTLGEGATWFPGCGGLAMSGPEGLIKDIVESRLFSAQLQFLLMKLML